MAISSGIVSSHRSGILVKGQTAMLTMNRGPETPSTDLFVNRSARRPQMRRNSTLMNWLVTARPMTQLMFSSSRLSM